MLLNFGKSAFIWHYLWLKFGLFSSADKVWVINLLSRFKIPVYTLRMVLFTENSIILGVFDRKKTFFEVFEFNRHLGINRHFVKKGKNWGVC